MILTFTIGFPSGETLAGLAPRVAGVGNIRDTNTSVEPEE
jgi:hypothetical protein